MRRREGRSQEPHRPKAPRKAHSKGKAGPEREEGNVSDPGELDDETAAVMARVTEGIRATPKYRPPSPDDTWLNRMPDRLKQFVSSSSNSISMRIFRDVVVRFPVKGASKPDIIALVEEFGPVEYIGLAQGPGDVAPAVSVGGEESGAADDRSSTDGCHLVRFDEGLHAIRCFMCLNGAIVDPRQHDSLLQQLKDAMAQQRSTAADEENKPTEENVADAAALAAMCEGLDSVEAMQSIDSTPLIVITVEFFRTAFVLPDTAKGPALPLRRREAPVIPPRCSLASSRLAPRFAAGGLPRLRKELRELALVLSHAHPVVVSHGIEWEEFTVLANHYSFIHSQKEPFDVCAAVHGDVVQSVEPGAKVRLAGVVRTLQRGLDHVKYDGHRMVHWLDASRDTAEEELLHGRQSRFATRRWERWGLHQLHVRLAMLAGTLILLALVLFLID